MGRRFAQLERQALYRDLVILVADMRQFAALLRLVLGAESHSATGVVMRFTLTICPLQIISK